MGFLSKIHFPSNSIYLKAAVRQQLRRCARIGTQPRTVACLAACSLFFAIAAPSLHAQNRQSVRSPLGVYVHVDVQDVIQQYGGHLEDQGCAQSTQDLHSYLLAASTRSCWRIRPSRGSLPGCTGTRSSWTTRFAS